MVLNHGGFFISCKWFKIFSNSNGNEINRLEQYFEARICRIERKDKASRFLIQVKSSLVSLLRRRDVGGKVGLEENDKLYAAKPDLSRPQAAERAWLEKGFESAHRAHGAKSAISSSDQPRCPLALCLWVLLFLILYGMESSSTLSWGSLINFWVSALNFLITEI